MCALYIAALLGLLYMQPSGMPACGPLFTILTPPKVTLGIASRTAAKHSFASAFFWPSGHSVMSGPPTSFHPGGPGPCLHISVKGCGRSAPVNQLSYIFRSLCVAVWAAVRISVDKADLLYCGVTLESSSW